MEAPGPSSHDLRVAYRWMLVLVAAVSLGLTWDLWRVRDVPPMLPALPLPQLDVSAPLLCALVLVLFRPGLGVGLFALLLAYAMLVDQTRIQPEFVSLTFLMAATLPDRSATLVGRAHLLSLWTWSGINKLLSPAFIAVAGPGLLTDVLPSAPMWLLANAGYIAGLSELSIGLLAVAPRTRRAAAVLALVVHTTILLVLSPLGRDSNHAVWAWNAALALAGVVLIAPWRESLPEAFCSVRWFGRVLVVALVIMPAGFYAGVVDAYVSHNLYSSNTPRATAPPVWTSFNVPFPPEHRLFEQSFQLTCRDGDVLKIRDSRSWFVRSGLALRRIPCHPRH